MCASFFERLQALPAKLIDPTLQYRNIAPS